MTAGRRCALPIGSAVRSCGSMGCNAVPPDTAGKRRKTGAGPGTFNAAASARASKRGMRWPSRKIPAPARGAVPTSLSRLQRFTDGLQTGIKIHGQRPWVYSWTGTFRSRWETSGKRRGKWMAPSARGETGVESGYPFCSPVARGEGLGIGARGEGRGAGQKVAGPFRSTSRKSPCLKVRRKFCVAPKVPRTLAIPFRAPIGATGGQATVCACRSSGAGKALCCRVAGSWG